VRTNCRSIAGVLILATVAAYGCGGPNILSTYGSAYGLHGFSHGTRTSAHNGVDFAGGFGAPVLAAAEGRVTRAGTIGRMCGIGVYIKHEFGLHTEYCHLSTVHVVPGATIERGQTIGAIGMSGNAGDVTHVHFMLGLQGEYDPMQYIVGCYESGVKYPTDRILLTYPVKCRN